MTAPKNSRTACAPVVIAGNLVPLLENLRTLITESRRQALRAVDTIQVRTCWEIGRHIVEFEQGGAERADYGAGLLRRLAENLKAEFGRGFDASNLRYMRLFYRAFPNCDALRHELSWTHYRLLLRVEDGAAREWYMNEAAGQGWNTRALERQIGTLYFERLLASKDRKPLREEAGQKLVGQKQIKALESHRNEKRRSLFEAQDRVDQQRETLIATIEANLDQSHISTLLFTIRWSLA